MKQNTKRKEDQPSNGSTNHEKPYAMLGAGNLTAALWKHGDERSGWHYQFNIFRMRKGNGRVSQRFSPHDVADLAKLAQIPAFALSDDGCLEQGLRDDLSCLFACLDEVFQLDDRPGTRILTDGSPAAEALREVMDYLWEDEERHFADEPTRGHIYRQLVALDRWSAGVGPASGIPLPAAEPASVDDQFGGCPICGLNDGYLHVQRVHWCVCHTHRLRWNIGENRFSTWRNEKPDAWDRVDEAVVQIANLAGKWLRWLKVLEPSKDGDAEGKITLDDLPESVRKELKSATRIIRRLRDSALNELGQDAEN